MASKRPLDAMSDGTSSPEEESAPRPKNKRAKTDTNSNSNSNPKRLHQSAHMDATWGQKYFFPAHEDATSVPKDPELEFEDDGDAMDYLRSVRNQASGIPHLLVAPKIGPQRPADDVDEDGDGGGFDRQMYDNGIGDFRGYYYDGAYTAAPEQKNIEEVRYEEDYEEGEVYDDEEDEEEARSAAVAEAYFSSIRDSFLSLRQMLHATPPEDLVAALPRTHSPFVGSLGPRSQTFNIWSKRLRAEDPLPIQVASMDRDGALRLLRIIMGGKFLRVGQELRERTSRWLWALLARLPDRGEMSHTDVAWVRDLGKRAVLMTRSIAEMAALREELEDGELGVNEGFDDSEDDEEVVEETAVDEGDEALARSSQQELEPGEEVPEQTLEEGEHEEDDVAMDLEEDGNMSDTEDLEAAKARLLARLEDAPSESDQADQLGEGDEAALRARMNMRATLNMIITVAGEFYGQLDLLEFRDPFTSV